MQKAQRAADRDSDADEDERYEAEMRLMTKHAEQRVAIEQGENLKLEDEMEEVSAVSSSLQSPAGRVCLHQKEMIWRMDKTLDM